MSNAGELQLAATAKAMPTRGLLATLDPLHELLIKPVDSGRVRADLISGFAATPDSAIPAQVHQLSARI